MLRIILLAVAAIVLLYLVIGVVKSVFGLLFFGALAAVVGYAGFRLLNKARDTKRLR